MKLSKCVRPWFATQSKCGTVFYKINMVLNLLPHFNELKNITICYFRSLFYFFVFQASISPPGTKVSIYKTFFALSISYCQKLYFSL